MGGSRGGGQGSRPPSPEKSQNIGFLCKTGPDPLKNHKATKPAFNVGPFIAAFESSISTSTKKTVIKFGHPLTKLSRSTHECDYVSWFRKLFCLLLLLIEIY